MYPTSSNAHLKVALSPYLHSNDGVDEEQHGNEETDVRQSLRGDTSDVWAAVVFRICDCHKTWSFSLRNKQNEWGVDLEGLDKGPQQDADGFSLPQQLDETSRPEQPQETQVDEIILQKSNNMTAEKDRDRVGCTKQEEWKQKRSSEERGEAEIKDDDREERSRSTEEEKRVSSHFQMFLNQNQKRKGENQRKEIQTERK